MWENSLKKIDHLVTPRHAIELWNGDFSSLKLINNQINCVYYFLSNNHGFYLRITHHTIRSYAELQASIDYQKYLYDNSAPVCKPVLSKYGNYIEEITQGNLVFFVTVVAEIPGQIMNFEHEDKDIYYTWGKALAKLHQLSLQYHPQSNRYKIWQDLWQETASYLAQEDEQINQEYKKINTWFQNLSNKDGTNYGLIHGDHRTGNVLLDGKRIYFIDFDEPIYHWFLADITMPFLELCEQPFEQWKHKFNWYIEGYCSILPVSVEQLRNIHWFTRMKSMGIYLWCKNNWHEETAPGGKPIEKWLNELRSMLITPIFPIDYIFNG